MYYKIFEGVITSVATSAISATVKSAFERYFGRGSKGQETAEEAQYPIMSIPLAIGYYYNFIEKIEDGLGGGNFTVQKHYTLKGDQVFNILALTEEQKSRMPSSELNQLSSKKIEMAEFLGQFETSDVSVELIYPMNLSNPATRSCSEFLYAKTKQGSISSRVSGRPYGINYSDNLDGDSSVIRIVDYTRPIEAIPKYYQEVRHIGGMGSDQELWKRIEDREMQAFLFTLKYMIENKAKFLFNKVFFRPYDPATGGTNALS